MHIVVWVRHLNTTLKGTKHFGVFSKISFLLCKSFVLTSLCSTVLNFVNLLNVDLGTLILKCKILYTISEIALIILKLEVCRSFTLKKSGAVAIRFIKLPYFSTLSMFIYCAKQLMAS